MSESQRNGFDNDNFVRLSRNHWRDKDGLIRFGPNAIIPYETKRTGILRIEAVTIVFREERKREIKCAIPKTLFSIGRTRGERRDDETNCSDEPILLLNVEEYDKLPGNVKRIITRAWEQDIPFRVLILWQDYKVKELKVKTDRHENQKRQQHEKTLIKQHDVTADQEFASAG